jgi:predicted metalloprotease with PDZ domain
MTVAAVTAGSEAERAGLVAGDTILEINGKIAGQESSREIARLNPGDAIAVKIRRRGAERELKWKVGSREEVSYELKDLSEVTAEQRARRTAWLKGEAEIPQGAQAH